MKKLSTLLLFIGLFYARTGVAELNDFLRALALYDLNNDEKISEAEYYIADGASWYREHLSNIYQSLSPEDKMSVTDQQYWFIEAYDSEAYKQHLQHYLETIAVNNQCVPNEDYLKTFKTGCGERYAKAIDINHDGQICPKEYLNFDFKMPSIGQRQMFSKMDNNHDGYIEPDEAKNNWLDFRENMRW